MIIIYVNFLWCSKPQMLSIFSPHRTAMLIFESWLINEQKAETINKMRIYS